MSDTPTALLSAERLAEIEADAEVYPIGCQRAVADLLAERAAREHKYTEALKSLLDEDQHAPENDFKRGINHERKANEKLVRAAAASLGIDLTK